MADLTFADSHNMVAYLEKSDANADFAEIVDFLNASPIRYALTVFANMRRKGKDFSGTVTPLFPSMLGSQVVEGEDKAVHEERGDSVERVAATAASLDAKQDSGGSPRCQEAIGDTIAQTRSERVYTPSYDSPLLGVNTPGSDEERIKHKELMDMCTKLYDRVLDLEKVKDAQALEIKKLKKRVKKLERKKKSRTPQLKRKVYKPRVESSEEILGKKDASKQGRNSDKTKELNIDEDEHMFDLSDLAGIEVVLQEESIELVEDEGSAKKGVSVVEDKDSIVDPVTTAGETVTTTSVNPEDSTAIDVSVGSPTRLVNDSTTDDVTLAETLMAVRSSVSRPQKLKGVIFKEPNSIEARIDVDAQLIESIKKFFAAKRAEEQSNKPPTKVEQRNKMCTYIKHMTRYKDNNFKGKSFDAIKQMFDKAYKQVNDFVPIDTESSGKKVNSSGKKAENSKKRTRAVLGEESVKR
ncbi:hypothetical protein Tco_1124798 [Tanacetum coccineum]|uniref:Uncharacterized protein n=1 Tax=Tanacetum coccineum TaxID=301880 RepID=A0ABQ5JA13_9ASTR